MRTLTAALAIVLALGFTAPAMAQGHGESKQTPLAVTIDLGTVGGGVLALVTASGLVGLYNAGSLAFQGTALAEALEVGAGLPLPAAVVALLVGGYYGQDIVKQSILPLFGASEPVKGSH